MHKATKIYGKIPGVIGRSGYGMEFVLAVAFQVYSLGLPRMSVITITEKYDASGNPVGDLPPDYRPHESIFNGRMVSTSDDLLSHDYPAPHAAADSTTADLREGLASHNATAPAIIFDTKRAFHELHSCV